MGLKKRRGIYYFKKTSQGKTIEKSLRTKNKKDAIRAANDWDRDLYAGIKGWESSISFNEWWKRFQKTYLPAMSLSAQTNYKRAVRQVADLWGERPLSSITSQECAAFVPRRLAEKGKPSTVALERQLLKSLLNRAVDEGVLLKSPWKIRQPLKLSPRMRVLTREEEEKILSVAPQDFQDILSFALRTGLRSSELCKADPSHIIHLPVTGLRVLGKGGKWRVVPLDEITLKLAQTVLPLGTTSNGLLHRLNTWASKVDIEDLTVHDLRRTFGTRCAESGMPIAILSELMGHSSITITAKYYIHISSTSSAEALSKALRSGEHPGEQDKKKQNP